MEMPQRQTTNRQQIKHEEALESLAATSTTTTTEEPTTTVTTTTTPPPTTTTTKATTTTEEIPEHKQPGKLQQVDMIFQHLHHHYNTWKFCSAHNTRIK